jgi:hypothetical protein
MMAGAKTSKAAAVALDVLEDVVRRADDRRETTAVASAASQATLARYRSWLDSNLAGQSAGVRPSEDEILRARAEFTTVEAQAARDELDALQAHRDASQARRQLREAQLAALMPRKREAMARVSRALLAARAEVDALVAIEDEESSIVGYVDRLAAAWNGLASGTPTFEPALDVWLRHLDALGFSAKE